MDAEPGDQTNIADAIRNRTEQRPDIQLSEGNALGRLLGSLFDFVINAVNGLLAMSVIIALIGIVNTQSLSIYERRRELGSAR
jgi:putative ABC transport system permease protein